MVNTDNEQIAAESLLALVGSTNMETASSKRHEISTALMSLDNNISSTSRQTSLDSSISFGNNVDENGFVTKVSEDESSQEPGQEQSSPKSILIPPTHRRHSCPVTAEMNINKPSYSAMNQDSISTNVESLPHTLMKLLTNEENQELMSFLPDDMTFIIVNASTFSQKVMPSHFTEDDFDQIIDKLKQLGFTHVILDKDQHLFSHPYFRKNDWSSLHAITRNSILDELQRSSSKLQRKTSRKRKFIEDKHDTCFERVKIPKNLRYQSPFAMGLHSSLEMQLEMSRQLKEEMIINKFDDFPSGSIESKNPFLSSLSTEISDRMIMAMMSTNNEVFNVTRGVIANAIDCLLVDEDHTLELIARSEKESKQSRRNSMPNSSQQRRSSVI